MLNFLKIKSRPFLILVIVGFFAFGVFIGFHNGPFIEKIGGISNKETPTEIKADFESFWKVWNIINEKYPNADKITEEKRINGAISGLMSSLDDPYSVYFNKEENKMFQDDISGSFTGVGMEVGMKDKVLTVIAPLKNTPADKAGVKSGDKIVKIDNTPTADLSVDRAIKLIRGEKGTTVKLKIYRDGENEPREISIVRDIINVPTLETELRKDGIFVIKLYSFSANSASLFRNAIKEFAQNPSSKLLLDLRGNPGGYLDSAVDMASWFLPGGKTVVIEDYGNQKENKLFSKKQNTYKSRGYDVFNENLKFVILIDKGSASASEILAGAMQDYKKAKIVGTTSYGKGSVQEVVRVTPDTTVKITVAKWLTPNGTSISEKGLTPDYKVEFTKKDIENKKDPQLEKAIELLNN